MNPAPAIGEINTSITYTLDRAKAVSCLGEGAFRAMRRAGLPVKYVAGRAFISGKALAEFIEAHGKESK